MFRPDDFKRYDESSDFQFYDSPRFVTHIDDNAIKALTKYYAKVFPPAGNPDVAILDICSSWISHYPKVGSRMESRMDVCVHARI